MGTAKAIWELMRLEHGVMIAIAILIGSLIALQGERFPPLDKFLLTFCTALFLEASTFALNDYYDREIDIKNKRIDRPLVRGDVSPKTALLLFFLFFPLGILCSFFVNMTCFLIALITALLAIVYDAQLKKFKLIGNFYIAYIMAIPFVFGGAAVIETSASLFAIHPAIYIIALIAFLTGSGREIMKDVMDVEGDIQSGVKSFPRYIGIHASNGVAGCFYLAAVIMSFFPFLLNEYDMYYQNYFYLLPVLITDVLLVLITVQLFRNKYQQMVRYRKLSLIAIFIGLLAFLIGTFVH
jgi:geranylgeranylglycerol-phosphate geranylgeranyltransferase